MATIYFTKRFDSGLLKGLTYNSAITFPDGEESLRHYARTKGAKTMNQWQKTVLRYMVAMRVTAMWLNMPTHRQWVYAQDVRDSEDLASVCADAIFLGPWHFRLTEPLNLH